MHSQRLTSAGEFLVTNMNSFFDRSTPLIMSFGTAHILFEQEVQFNVWRAARKASLIPRINQSLEWHRSPGHTTDKKKVKRTILTYYYQ